MNLLRSIRLDQTDCSPEKTPRKRLNDHADLLASDNSDSAGMAVIDNALSDEIVVENRRSLIFSRKETSGYTSSQCFHDYLTYKLENASNWNDPNRTQKHIKSMVTRVVTFYLNLASEDELQSFTSEPPPTGSISWQAWHRTWKANFEILEQRVSRKLKDEEERLQVEKAPKSFSNSLSALDKRLTRIKWQAPSTQVYSDADSSHFLGYFGRK